MTYPQLATIALGLAALVAGALIPATAAYAVPAGIGLLGLAIPAFAKKDPPKAP